MRIQFILKRNETYSFTHYCRRSSGLWNSVSFVSQALNDAGIETEQIEVIDNNCIDKNLTRFKPDVCIIEALWVVPEKFDVLKKLHPKVKFFAHMHSGVPFLALEGIAMQWLKGYVERGIGIIANSIDSYNAFKSIVPSKLLYCLLNTYGVAPLSPVRNLTDQETLNVGCFGAVRPMKNPLSQALASIQVARYLGKKLRFHINGSRIETGGDPVMKNLKQLFSQQKDACLVLWKWMELDEFIQKLHSDIDIGLQVSMSETFNFVAANYISAGLPIVVSREIPWASAFSQCKQDTIQEMTKLMKRALRWRCLIPRNQQLLTETAQVASTRWIEFAKAVG